MSAKLWEKNFVVVFQNLFFYNNTVCDLKLIDKWLCKGKYCILSCWFVGLEDV